TGAFIVIVYGIVQKHGVAGLTLATFMAGFLMVAMGLLRFGKLLKYFPHTLVVGFTSGIAVVILSSQVKDLFGLHMGTVPADMIDKWRSFGAHFATLNGYALALAVLSIVLTLWTGQVIPRIPGPLMAIVLCTALAWGLHWPVETIAG